MAIARFKAERFRCLSEAELELDRQYNLIHGANASGKTSLLEAMAYLGRGKSFRGASVQTLIQHGQRDFVLFAELVDDGRRGTVGVRNSTDGLEISVDGERGGGAAALAAALPLQVIDPAVHHLVSAGPEERRRFVDWIAFHVEQGYLKTWRDYRRALKQRNALLRRGDVGGLKGWDAEFLALAERVHASRLAALEAAQPALEAFAEELLLAPVHFDYARGWDKNLDMLSALERSAERDRQLGTSHVGPHRADLKLIYDERQARRLVSRGQQKLLACAMILAAADTVQTVLERPLLLLLDDPAAELDSDSLGRLMQAVVGLGSQVVATSLLADALEFPSPPATFHVEHGSVSRRD